MAMFMQIIFDKQYKIVEIRVLMQIICEESKVLDAVMLGLYFSALNYFN